MNQYQKQFPNNRSELNYALSDEPILLNGMRVIFDQQTLVYPVNLQLKDRDLFNNSLAKGLGSNSSFSGALEQEEWKDFLKLGINQEIYFPLNGNDRLNVLASDPWKLSQGFDGQCGFVAVIMATLYFAEQTAQETGKQTVIKELLNAIYYGNQYRGMVVTKRAVVKEGSILVKAKNSTIEVLTINIETKEEKFSPIQAEGNFIEIQAEANKEFRRLKLPFEATKKEQNEKIKVNSTEKFIRVKKVNSTEKFIRVKAKNGVVRNRLEKRLAHYLYIHKLGNIEYYSPLYVTDYVLYVGLMIFFKDHLKNNLNPDKPKIWSEIMDFNSIFPGFEVQAEDWKDNKPFKKLKDMKLGEKAYPGYKRGDLGLTREGLEELCLLMGIANINDSNRALNAKKNVQKNMTSFKALDVDQEEVISFEYQNNVTNNIDFFLLKFRKNDLKFPCILGVADGKRFLSHKGIIDNLEKEIAKETKILENYESRLKSHLQKKAPKKQSKSAFRKKNKQIKEPVQIKDEFQTKIEAAITAKKNMIAKYEKHMKNYQKNPEYDKSLKDQEAFSNYNFLEHWVFMPDSNTVWNAGAKFERTELPEKNSAKHNHISDLIARGIYWISVELVAVGNQSKR